MLCCDVTRTRLKRNRKSESESQRADVVINTSERGSKKRKREREEECPSPVTRGTRAATDSHASRVETCARLILNFKFISIPLKDKSGHHNTYSLYTLTVNITIGPLRGHPANLHSPSLFTFYSFLLLIHKLSKYVFNFPTFIQFIKNSIVSHR